MTTLEHLRSCGYKIIEWSDSSLLLPLITDNTQLSNMNEEGVMSPPSRRQIFTTPQPCFVPLRPETVRDCDFCKQPYHVPRLCAFASINTAWMVQIRIAQQVMCAGL